MFIALKVAFDPEPRLAATALDILTGPWPFAFVPPLAALHRRPTDMAHGHRSSWNRPSVDDVGQDAMSSTMNWTALGSTVLRQRSGCTNAAVARKQFSD